VSLRTSEYLDRNGTRISAEDGGDFRATAGSAVKPARFGGGWKLHGWKTVAVGEPNGQFIAGNGGREKDEG
jgi:hypothetical protein